jgi:hypothetical protein
MNATLLRQCVHVGMHGEPCKRLFLPAIVFESGNLNKPPIFAGHAFRRGFMQEFLRRPADFLQ